MHHETPLTPAFPLQALAVEHLRLLQVDAASHPRGVAHLSAASGMVWRDGQVIVVADDEHHIGIFDVAGTAPGRLLRMLEDDLPPDVSARKRLKPDTESLLTLPPSAAWPAGALLALGSGSRPNRQTGWLIPVEVLGQDTGRASGIMHIDLAPLYEPLREHYSDLNIEGAFVCGDELLLLQRGSTNVQSPNASIAFALQDVMRWLAAGGAGEAAPACLRMRRHDLGRIGEVPLCFTDGTALMDGSWLFSAVAENTDNSYADGVCTGAIIGVVNTDGRVSDAWSLPPALKVEAVAAQENGNTLTVLMATDADDPAQAAHLLRAVLVRQRTDLPSPKSAC
ncbi:hypothetical protein VVD49_06005 [Uliginosibacterium sp. H3]|uniref:DUF3616 domain-containing protein n=1 Tax=Uliginosibacterium silvisoli TaxID=3114758 RepID=A0ABU6K1H7_9RHOO|nr:hypothetical protein [Uliginosibacterium sp. H3]